MTTTTTTTTEDIARVYALVASNRYDHIPRIVRVYGSREAALAELDKREKASRQVEDGEYVPHYVLGLDFIP